MANFDKRTINDFLWGAGIGAVFDLLMPSAYGLSVPDIATRAAYIGVPSGILRKMQGFSTKDSLKAGGALYVGGAVGISAIQMGKYFINTIS
tara:strand:- start:50 stop:325 length:276 start_codon:yes stop_codon:yes gene_type:complete